MYYFSLTDSNSYCYSIDKLIITGKFVYNSFDDFSAALNSLLIKFTVFQEMPFNKSLCRDCFYESHKNLTYLNNFNFTLVDKLGTYSFWLGTHFQNFDCVVDGWKLELNPNKCLPCDFVSSLVMLLLSFSKFYEISEFDIAVDLPFSRDSFFLIKDRRKYQCVENSSSDKTEYLGTRHSSGFCKLYNKQNESKLDYPLTRFEITLDTFDLNSIKSFFPTIYFLKSQLELCDIKLSDTDLFILKTLIFEPSRIRELSKYKRKRFKILLDCAVSVVSFDFDIVKLLLDKLLNLTLFFRGAEVID